MNNSKMEHSGIRSNEVPGYTTRKMVLQDNINKIFIYVKCLMMSQIIGG